MIPYFRHRAPWSLAAAAVTAMSLNVSADVPLAKVTFSESPDPDGKPPDIVLATGCGSPGGESFGRQIAEAQPAMNGTKKTPDFSGNVKCVDIRDFWPAVEDSPNPKQGDHCYKNAGTCMEVGNSLGWSMADLLKANK